LTVELINKLADALNSHDIVYCHWKSNFSLERALSGELDLDLLVERKALSQCMNILLQLGFKSADVKWGPDTPPAVFHFYGFDDREDQIIHVHLFSNILSGESFVKSHLFPFERMLFENTVDTRNIKTVSKPAELALFVLRTFIKYGSLLDLVYLLRDPNAITQEVRWLLADKDSVRAWRLLEKYCPVIDEQLYNQCIDALNQPRSLTRKLLLSWRVRRRLRIYAKHSVLKRATTYLHLLTGQALRRLNNNKKNKVLRSGGAVIAIVGPEATGKSTLVFESSRWLGSVFAVRVIHAGKPPSSWLTLPVNKFLPFIRRSMPRLRTTRIEGGGVAATSDRTTTKTMGLNSLVYAFRANVLAWDRRNLLLKNRRAAASGEIVICDRYPSAKVGVMDSRRLQEDPSNEGIVARIYNRLARLEQRLYAQISPPDIVLRLKVSVETAKQRNRDRVKSDKESDDYLEFRHLQNQNWWHMNGVKYVYDIDTGGSLEETILIVKKAIWEVL
jgi:thymidylate kinase